MDWAKLAWIFVDARKKRTLTTNVQQLGDKAGTLTVKTAEGTTAWTTAPKG